MKLLALWRYYRKLMAADFWQAGRCEALKVARREVSRGNR